MSAVNCPFKLVRPVEDFLWKPEDQYVTFKALMDPDNPDLGQYKLEVKKLMSTEPEDLLDFFWDFDDLIQELDVPEGPPRFRLVRFLLAGALKETWNTLANQYVDETQDSFDKCRTEFILQYVSRDIALDTKAWMRKLKKPFNMTVYEYLARIRYFNCLISLMPSPLEDGDAEPCLTKSEILTILERCGPRDWQNTQMRANLCDLSLTDQAQYYESLRCRDEEINSNRNNNRIGGGRNNKNNNNNRSRRNNKNNNNNRSRRNNNSNNNQNNNRTRRNNNNTTFW